MRTPVKKNHPRQLVPRWHGTVAKIGAGHEVARWFVRVGRPAGMIGKPISPDDMAVTDAIYGGVDRYGSMGRLQAILDHQYQLNLDRLEDKRGDTASFFAFANKVAARSFKRNNDCHRRMGLKFQDHPRDDPSQIIFQVGMLDVESALQREAMGIVGIRLLHHAYFSVMSRTAGGKAARPTHHRPHGHRHDRVPGH